MRLQRFILSQRKGLDIYKISVTLTHMNNKSKNPFVNVQKRMLASERKAAIRLGNRANRAKTTKKKAFVNPLDWVAASR